MRAIALRLAAAGALVLGLSLPAAAQRNWDEIRIETTQVAPGVWMMTGGGGNLGLSAGEDGVLLIDDQFAPLTEKIRAAIAALSDRPIRFVVNTHCHRDHTGGNENLGGTGSIIVAHDNVRVRMRSEHFSTFFDRTTPPSPADALPVVTFTDSVTFHLNGDEIHAFHVPPAHTDGDSLVHFRRANVIHIGDLFFNRFYPFVDLDSGGSVDGVIAAVRRVLALADDDTVIIPGHGPPANRKELGTYLKMLQDVRDRVAKIAESGRSLEQAIAAKPTAAWDEQWDGGFVKPEAFVKMVYQSLTSD